MKYFADMIVGVIIQFMVCFVVAIFYSPSIFLTQFVMGVLFPCMMLGIYSIFRYRIVKEKPVTEPYVIGNIIGYILEFEVLYLIETYYPEHFIFQIRRGHGSDTGESLSWGIFLLALVVIIPIISSIFLHFLWRNKPLNIDPKEEKRGEGLGFAVCFPIMAYSYIALVLEEYPKKYYYEEIANHPTIVFLTWLRCLAVCLFIILIAYWGERGKNIRTILILYTCETVVFFAAIKIFHLNYPALPLAGLGGTIVLGAGIYKGLEKLFAFVNARVEQEISESKIEESNIEERDKIRDYIRGILVTAGLAIAVTLISQRLFDLVISMFLEFFFNSGKSSEILLLCIIGAIMIPFIIKMYKMLKGKYYVFVPTCYWICFTLFIVCQSNSLLEGESIYEWRFGIMTGISLLLSTIFVSMKRKRIFR